MNNILYYIILLLICLYCIVQTIKLEKTKEKLKHEILKEKILQKKNDDIRSFKHDFSNIIAGIDGYIKANDMMGLKDYHNKFLKDYNQINNIEVLNSDSINNPAILSILTCKYFKAEDMGVKLNIECFIDFNKLSLNIYIFSRILGILLDNAIEAAKECADKIVNIQIRDDIARAKQILVIENTYKNKDIDINQIYEKGYSTKVNNTGIGLWSINQMIKRCKNAKLFTNKSDMMFTQKLEIYY